MNKYCFLAIVGGYITNLIGLAIYAGYNVKLSERTAELEKKNGKEGKAIELLQAEMEQLKKQVNGKEKGK
jgi:hypothetical protein